MARKEELARFRALSPGSISCVYYDDVEITSRAKRSVDCIADINAPKGGQSRGGNQVVPSPEYHPLPGAMHEAGHDRIWLGQCRNFQFAEQLRCEEITRFVQGSPSSGPTGRDVEKAEQFAQYYSRRSFCSLGGKLAVSSERKRCMALARHLRQETSGSDSMLRVAVAILPYVVDHCLVEIRDLHRILHHGLGISYSSLDVEEIKRILPSAPPGFVFAKNLLRWYVSRDHRNVPKRVLQHLERKRYAQSVVECRDRAIARTELYKSVVDKRVYVVRRVLRSWLRRQALATEQDGLKVRLKAIADSSSRRNCNSRYVRWQMLYCEALEAHFRGLAGAFHTQPRLAALKQAEYFFALFDVDGDGVLPVDMLDNLFQRFNLLLDSSQLLTAQKQIVVVNGCVRWADLQSWLLACSFPITQRRLAQGWKGKKKRFRKDAMDRIVIAGRRRALKQLDVVLGLETKWQSVCDMHEGQNVGKVLEGVDTAETFPSVGSAKEASDALQLALNFFSSYFTSVAGNEGSRDDDTMLSELSSTQELHVTTEKALDESFDNAIIFAQEYGSVRFSLKEIGDGRRVVYDDKVSPAALIVEEVSMARSPSSPAARKKNGQLPLAWYYWFGGTRQLFVF